MTKTREQRGELALRIPLVDVRIPAADVDEADVELVGHQTSHAPRLELESLRGKRVAIRCLHLAGEAAVRHHLRLLGDRLAKVKAFADERLEPRAGVHAGEQSHLPIVERRATGSLQRHVRDNDVAGHHHRQAVGE